MTERPGVEQIARAWQARWPNRATMSWDEAERLYDAGLRAATPAPPEPGLAEKVRALPTTPIYNDRDEADYMCGNCVTPWKCNGPHEPPELEPDGYLVNRAAVLSLLLAATPAPSGPLREALWQCGVESGMDTDGDDGPAAMIAGMGEAGFAATMVESVRRLRADYNECLGERDR